MKGKKRRVVEVLDKVRAERSYKFRVRLECGHVTSLRSRESKAFVPVASWCNDPGCINPEGQP